MSTALSYQKNPGGHEYTPVNVDEGTSVVVEMGSTRSSPHKRKLLLGGALGLWVAFVALSKSFSSSNVPLMDVLTPDGRHDVSSDKWVPMWLDQKVDHFDESNTDTFKQKYFTYDKFWKGPGHPIFFILGGEDPMDNLITTLSYYYMPKDLGGTAFGVEHRYDLIIVGYFFFSACSFVYKHFFVSRTPKILWRFVSSQKLHK